jgi:hypothetical protein
MATDISMSSNALLLIGHGTINSFTDAGAGARAASNLYETVYEDALTGHPWRFAMGKVALSKLTASPLNEWTNAFQLPGDLLLVYRTYPRSSFEIYEDKLYSDSDSVEIDYWFKPEETALPPYFVKYMQYLLASEFAISVTDNRSLAETFAIQAETQKLKAIYADSQGRTNNAIESAPFIEVR